MFGRRIIIGFAVALAGLPALAQESELWKTTSRGTPLVEVSNSRRVSIVNPPSPDFNQSGSSDNEGPGNSPLAERLRAARRGTPASTAKYSNYSAYNATTAAAMQEPVATGPQTSADWGTNSTCGDSCGSSCDTCSTCGSCGGCNCCDFWQHRCGVFADYLNWNVHGAQMAYGAQAITGGGPIATPGNPTFGDVPYGRVGVLDPENTSAYRVGGTLACDSCSSFTGTYTQFQSHEEDALVAPPNNLVGSTTVSFVLHPGTANYTTPTSLRLDNIYDIDVRSLDIDYSHLVSGSCNHYLNYVIGVKWASLDQQFAQLGSFAQPLGEIVTSSSIGFDGAGLRAGLDGRRRMGCGGWSVYSKGFVDVLFGEFRSRYNQFNVTTDTLEATSNWQDERVVPILEYEVGLSWQNCSGRLRVSTGYYTAFWFNTVTTGQWINAVQNSNFLSVDDYIAFEGLTTRVEYRF